MYREPHEPVAEFWRERYVTEKELFISWAE